MSYNFNELYNILIRKVNEIIDTMEQLEELDDVAFKSLNEYLNDMNDKLEKGYDIDWDLIGEKLDKIQEDVDHLKGVE